jgi:hypothetical protein
MVVELVKRGGRFNESVSCGVWFRHRGEGDKGNGKVPVPNKGHGYT